MAVTGVILLGFVVGHLAGNLLIFGGPDTFNAYGEKLRHMAPVVWAARVILLIALVIHIKVAALLTFENARARPQDYVKKKFIRASETSRTMFLTGLVVFAFILYHLMHFTFKSVHPEFSGAHDALGRHDIYSMVTASFSVPAISATYISALMMLAFHLNHGVTVFLQTLGLNNVQFDPKLRFVGTALVWLIFAGYVSIPISVLLGHLPVLAR